MKTLFIVDDNPVNLKLANKTLSKVYRTYPLLSAEKMFSLLEEIKPDLILLDVEMPEMNGFEALSILKKDEKLKTIPVVFLTARNDEASETLGFEMGAVDFLIKPFSPPVLLKRIEMHIETDKIIKNSLQSVRKVHNATINIVANMVENRDRVTGGHIARTQKYLTILIYELLRSGVYAEEIKSWNLEELLPSAQLHDVGKIVISDLILNKTDKLTDTEFELIKNHCEAGELIIDGIIKQANEDGFLNHAKRFAGSHHEKWDGTGYPRRLANEKIPLEARIMAIVDVYDALVSERPYKKPFTHEQAIEIIKEASGTHFDPKIVDAFLNVANDFLERASFDMNKLLDIYNGI